MCTRRDIGAGIRRCRLATAENTQNWRTTLMTRLRYVFGIALTALAVGGIVTQSVWSASGKVGPAAASNASPVVAIVNGKPIKPEFAAILSRDLAAGGQHPDEATNKAVAERLITNELLVQEAHKSGLDKNPDVVLRFEMLRRDVLANAYLQSYLAAHPITDQQIEAEYERRKAQLAGTKEYRVRHILLADETVAREVTKQLDAGRDFEQLVDDFSIDDGSRNRSGSLGWISLENGDKTLVDAVAALEPGHSSKKPVRTALGWHVMKLDASRDIQILPFEAVKDRLRQHLQQRQSEELAQTLKAKAIVVWPGQQEIAANTAGKS
jgi:peptidyl-prolyl cis-trans isomerase C